MTEDQEFTLPPLEERPLVTFALFAYNQEKYIREAVEGAFAQTYDPLEIILSDDCSTDSTFLIMQQMADEYEGPHTVRVVRNAFNMGVLKHVFERGRDVQGSIIVMAAGDDISFPHRTGRRRCQPQFIDQQCAGTFRWRSLAKPREDHEPEVLACIEATFIAEYRYDEELDEKGLGEFAHRNAGYHIWPFWREYLVSQCDRMRLPRVIVPTMRV